MEWLRHPLLTAERHAGAAHAGEDGVAALGATVAGSGGAAV